MMTLKSKKVATRTVSLGHLSYNFETTLPVILPCQGYGSLVAFPEPCSNFIVSEMLKMWWCRGRAGLWAPLRLAAPEIQLLVTIEV